MTAPTPQTTLDETAKDEAWAEWLLRTDIDKWDRDAAWMVTGRPELAAAELVAHWAIDFAKCENWTGPTQDQGLHIACKMMWAAL